MVENVQITGRCSLIAMTPMDKGDLDDIIMTDRSGQDGYDTQRSKAIQLTGIKPKALIFASPAKSPPIKEKPIGENGGVFSTASTKAGTASGGQQKQTGSGLHTTFGLSNCLYKCEVNEQEGSPEVE